MSVSRKKVLLLIPSLGGGGAERVFSLLLSHLDRNRFELHLGILLGQGEYLSDLPADVTVHHLGISRVRYSLPALLRLVWKLRPGTILSTLGHLNLALVLIRPFMPGGIRLLVREAAIVSVIQREEGRHPRLYSWLYRHFYKRADKIICLSDSMVSDLAEHFGVPREKMVRIYNPVDVKRVQGMAGNGVSPYSGPGPHLVAAGRLTRQKGFDVLLSAMPSVLDHVPDARLTILGEGELRQRLLGQAQSLGLEEKVSFLGFQRDLWLYLRYADLFVFPSRYEGTPNVLLEALALGTPVVATDCPGGTREIQVRCPQVVLVPAESPAVLADAIVATLKRPRCAATMETLESQLRDFEVEKIVDEYARLLVL